MIESDPALTAYSNYLALVHNGADEDAVDEAWMRFLNEVSRQMEMREQVQDGSA